MPPLDLSLCGPITLVDAHGCDLSAALGAKAVGLLAYLALERGAHSREALTALLWGESPDEKARASLRQTLVQLRQVLGDTLRADRLTIRLDAAVTTDVDALRQAGHPDGGAAALRVDVARFLRELPVRHCAAFDEWADATREALVRAAVRALAERARDATARLDWGAATAAAGRWCALSPLDDAAARVAIEARYLSGDLAGALALHGEHVARVRTLAGRAPERALDALAERMEREARAGRATSGAAARVDTPVHGVPAAGWAHASPLRGRDAEWRVLRDAWQDAAGGACRAVLLEGGLGAGKTRLAGDFARWCEARRGVVLRVRARQAQRHVPYAAVAQLVHVALDVPGVAGVDGAWLSELSRVVPEVRARFPGVPAPPAVPADGWRTHEAMARLLVALAADRALLVLVDDAEWLDAESAAALRGLVERSADAPVLWALALTDGRVTRDAPGVALARALGAAPGTLLVRLDRLTLDDVRALVADALPGADDAARRRLGERVHADTAGMPGYVALHLDALRARAGAADDPPPDARPFTVADHPAVRAPILERLAELGDDARGVLTMLAVAEAPCDVDTLSHAAGISRLRAATLGSVLVERGLACEAAGAFACVHAVAARVVRDASGAVLRRELHRALAHALSGLAEPAGVEPGARAARHARIAHHAVAGGASALAHRHGCLAVEAALDGDGPDAHAPDAALDWASTALAHAATPEEARAAERLRLAVVARGGARAATGDPWPRRAPISAR